MNKKLSGTIFIKEKKEKVLTLYDKILEDNPTKSERTDFSTPFTTNTAKIQQTHYIKHKKKIQMYTILLDKIQKVRQ